MSKHPLTDFLKYIGTPFERYILPIIPAGADISADSSLTPEHLGKIPGSWSTKQRVWYGYAGWQRLKTTKSHLEKWQSWQDKDKADRAIALALRLSEVVAADIDVNDAQLADEIEARVRKHWGDPLCIRRREGSARRVLLYLHKSRTMPITKGRLAFTCPQTGDEMNALEILGWGQQVVIEGPHAKGAMHYWQDGFGLADVCEKVDGEWKLKGNLKPGVVTTDDARRLIMDLAAWINSQADEGWKVHVSGKTGSLRDPSKEHQIDSPNNPHYLPPDERTLLTKAINAIDLNDERLDGYDDWFKLMLAICASVGRDMDYFHEVVLPWLETNPINEPDAMELKWRNAFSTSTLGASYVYHVAALFGFTEGMQKLNDDLVAALYPKDADSEDGATSPDTGEAGDAESVGDVLGVTGAGASGPLPPGHTDVALLESFIKQHEQRFRIIPELGPNAWNTLRDGLWVPAYPEFARAVLTHCSAVGDWHRRNSGKPGAGIDMAMKSGNTHARLERMLAKSPELVTPLNRFDTEPNLINTPDWVVNPLTLEAYQHDDSHLFRMRTLVSPDFGLHGPPMQWLSLIERLGAGRDYDLEPILQRFFGYMFTGYMDWQLTLFMPGVMGTGKSLIVKIIEALAHTYGVLKPPEFFVLRRNPDDRFAYDDLAGKRMILATETIDNATWNETRLVQIIDGDNLNVEFKRGAKLPIPSKAKILVSGNHEPRFPTGDRAGGLQRRMMQLDIGNAYVLSEADKDDTLMRRIIEEEGPQIMWWLIQGAHLALTGGRKEFVQMAAPLLQAAKEAIADSDPRRLWLEDRGIVEGDADKDYILLRHAHMDYQQFRQTDERGFTERRGVFKKAMSEMFGWKWEKVHRGEKDVTKHGYMAVYGWKKSQSPITAEGLYVGS